jgi:alkanesulfonate monooxygenase SsuD/methylene tetrahydromethanopterin reductase-like flavin-dependent oxidoreductase (luciferase family)
MGPARFSVMTGHWPGEVHPDGAFFAAVGAQAEALGYYGAFAGDHLVLDTPMPDCLTTLTYFAAGSTRLAVGPMVLQLPLRPLLATAKTLATLDALSGGRLVVCAGVGGEHPREWHGAGVSRRDRGARMDAYLAALPRLLAGATVSADDPYLSLDAVALRPVGPRPGGPPIWIGGRAPAALARASRFGGWCAYAESVRGFARKREEIERLRGDADGDFRFSYLLFTYVGDSREQALAELAPRLAAGYGDGFTAHVDKLCAVGTADDVAERVAQYEDAGATDLILAPQCSAAAFAEQLDRLAQAVRLRPASLHDHGAVLS